MADMTKCVILNTDTHKYLEYVGLARRSTVVEPLLWWTHYTFNALIFNADEAEATIDFIRDVLDSETAEFLEVVEI